MRKLHADEFNNLPGSVQSSLIGWAEASLRKQNFLLKMMSPIVSNVVLWICYLLLKGATQGVEGVSTASLLEIVVMVNKGVGLLSIVLLFVILYGYRIARQEAGSKHAYLCASFDMSLISPDDVLTKILMPRLASAGLTKKEYLSISRSLWWC